MILHSELPCFGHSAALCASDGSNIRSDAAAPRLTGRGRSHAALCAAGGSCHLLMRAVTVLSLAACAAAAVYGYRMGIFTSVVALRRLIAGFGSGGALVFIAFQALQVVVPILPGGLGCLCGVLMFGAWKGFLCNYLGICAGSMAAFQIARHFGRPVLKSLFSDDLIKRYDIWTSAEGNFAKWFALAIFLPVAPDDYLCYLAGRAYSNNFVTGKISVRIYDLNRIWLI